MTPSGLGGSALSKDQRARLIRLGARAAMFVPVATAGKAVGAMALLATGRHLGSDDLTLAEAVAMRLASALENARLYQAARDAIRVRDDALTLAAHELRTPLTSLQLAVDGAVRRSQREPQAGRARELQVIANQVRRLAALVERLLDAVRVRADGLRLDRGASNLAAIVHDRVKTFDERARRAGTSIAVRGVPTLPGSWDPVRIAQLVDNLLDNEIKFAGAKPIEVDVRREGGDAVLTVRDHGIGIRADRLPSIFSLFERAVPKENFGGLGLGLYLANAIAAAHGGFEST